MSSSVGGDRTALVVFDLQTWKLLNVAARFNNADIGRFHWVNDERLVFDILDRTRGSGDWRWWPGLYSVGRDGKDLRNLVKLQRDFVVTEPRIADRALEFNHELLHVPAGNGDEVFVGEWRFAGSGEFDAVNAMRLNEITGRTRSLSYGVPAHVRGWLFSPDGEPRVVVTRPGCARGRALACGGSARLASALGG